MSMSRGLVVIAATLLVVGATTAWNRGYRIVILPPPLPAPIQESPAEGTVIDDSGTPETYVSWHAVPDAAGYVVEIDTFKEFWVSEIGQTEKLLARITMTPLHFKDRPGRWRWRVYALDKDDNKGLKSPWREIRYRP